MKQQCITVQNSKNEKNANTKNLLRLNNCAD